MGSIMPVLGIDPGARWTAGVLVVPGQAGFVPVHGWTVGPRNKAGGLDPEAADDLANLAATARMISAVIDAAEETVGIAEAAWGRCGVAVEGIRIPASHMGGQRSRVPMRSWITPRTVAAAVLAVWPHAVIVPPGQNGKKRAREEYPLPLRARRPADWGRCDARRGERDHERAAYDVACEGAAMLPAPAEEVAS